MIVILSYHGDQVANSVIEWLHSYNCSFKRVNLETEDFRNLSLTMDNKKQTIQLMLQDRSVLKLEEVSCFFFRGGLLSLKLNDHKQEELPSSLIENHLSYERNTLVQFFYKEIAQKCLGNILLHPLNKLEQLKFASSVGLAIPNTIVCNSKKQLQRSMLKREKKLITKSIQENAFYQQNPDFYYELKVNEIASKGIEARFFPSLFQKSIDKLMEIRVFYLDGKFYSIAMLLFSSKKHIVDYRTATQQIRYSCYQLPGIVKNKLQQLMNKIGLNTGSIDLILGKDGQYYFLEINPTGQIGWVSDYGFYCIEEKIALYLLKKEINFINEQQTAVTR